MIYYDYKYYYGHTVRGRSLATAFSENEKKLIKAKLNDVAQVCLGKYGVKRTTVEQLAQMAGISKGAFYIFYPTKEILFFNVFEEYQKSVIEAATSKLSKTVTLNVQGFSELIYGLFQNMRQSFIMNIIQQQEFDYLIRKLPVELITSHHSFDDMISQNLFSYLKVKDNIVVGIVTGIFKRYFHEYASC